MLIPADHVNRKRRSARLPISLVSALVLLAGGALVLGWLFRTGIISLRPANFPGIGIATNVGSGASLGFGWIVESRVFTGMNLPLGITAFWGYVLVTVSCFIGTLAEVALRRKFDG